MTRHNEDGSGDSNRQEGSFSLNDLVIDPEDVDPDYDPGGYISSTSRSGDTGGDNSTVIDPEAPAREDDGQDSSGEDNGNGPPLADVLMAERVWKARVGITGPKAREREERDRLKLVEGGGRAKPPVADPTTYEEHERRRRKVMEKLEQERARKRRRGGR